MSPKSAKEAQALFDHTKNTVGRLRSVTIVIAPPALYIPTLKAGYGGNKIALSAQEISVHEEGSHTGEISAEQYAHSGAKYALVGHSECNASLGDIRIQTFLAVKHNLTPIVFIGESQRDAHGAYLETVQEQILASLEELSLKQVGTVVFCYEPVWAIGQAEPMDTYDIHTMMLFIRKVIAESYGPAMAKKIQVLYGGSVNSKNITGILAIDAVDGVAVGRASTDAMQFAELLKIANKV